LWLHFPDDPKAVARDDEYLWGRNLLIAPVVEKGATSRAVYLPQGRWYDFWTREKIEGGREVVRAIDLATLPMYVRAGAILPLGPVKQYTSQKIDEPLAILVYPGSDASFLLYEDDGRSFNYRKGEWMGIQIDWSEMRGRLSLRLAEGSHMLPPSPRDIDVSLVGKGSRRITFDGTPVEVLL
jgi:alpha-glucosidase (family GH31 glycosyl hydrolase)